MTPQVESPAPHAPVPPQNTAVRSANRTSDYWVLVAGIAASLGLLALVLTPGISAWLYGDEVMVGSEASEYPIITLIVQILVYGFFIAVALGFILALVRMMRQQYLGNALQVEYSDHSWLRDWSNQVATDLQMPRVEIMVVQNPVMNAFAFGFARPYTIVLHSGTIRWLSADQLKAVVVHEMAHVKYHHTKLGTYLTLLRMIPAIGAVNAWFLDFWGRRAEYTADRLAVAYLQDRDLVKEALIGIHIGPDVASSFNEVARQWQAHMTDNYLNKFTQTFSSHPFLVRRLRAIDEAQVVASSPAAAGDGVAK